MHPGMGLSPLARGNPPIPARKGPSVGPIPARAGEPGFCLCLYSSQGAYPRSRGGTVEKIWPLMGYQGLSPLARGNRYRPTPKSLRHGPIPARAGEPKVP